MAQQPVVSFDIPAQPLDQALDALGAASGMQIFYEAELTAGRTSQSVKGVFDPNTALRMLLKGSNLAARSIAANTITIVPLDLDADLRQAKRQAAAFYGLMQSDIMNALCRGVDTRPGSYRVMMQYWIDDASGRISQLKLITPSGDAARDLAIERALRDVVFQSAVRNLPQPVTLAIEPNASASCASTDRAEMVPAR